MTKSEIVKNIYDKYKSDYETELEKNEGKVVFSKAFCEHILDLFAEEVKCCLVNGDKLTIKEFVSFEVSERPERNGRNPKTGEVITFPAVKSVKCKMSKAIKDAINGK